MGFVINALRMLAQSIGWMSAGYVASDVLDKVTESSGNPASGESSASKRIGWAQSVLGIPRFVVWIILIVVGYLLIKTFKIKIR